MEVTMREILTSMIQVGIAIGMGEELDHDKEWHLERAEQQINKLLIEARKDQDKHSRGDEFLWFVRKIREYGFDKNTIEQNLIAPNEGKYKAYFEEKDRLKQLQANIKEEKE